MLLKTAFGARFWLWRRSLTQVALSRRMDRLGGSGGAKGAQLI